MLSTVPASVGVKKTQWSEWQSPALDYTLRELQLRALPTLKSIHPRALLPPSPNILLAVDSRELFHRSDAAETHQHTTHVEQCEVDQATRERTARRRFPVKVGARLSPARSVWDEPDSSESGTFFIIIVVCTSSQAPS
jgi:hypothetical protein